MYSDIPSCWSQSAICCIAARRLALASASAEWCVHPAQQTIIAGFKRALDLVVGRVGLSGVSQLRPIISLIGAHRISEADILQCNRHVRFTPNSDIDCVFRHVRFGPKADIADVL